jgi:hypothetical protein
MSVDDGIVKSPGGGTSLRLWMWLTVGVVLVAGIIGSLMYFDTGSNGSGHTARLGVGSKAGIGSGAAGSVSSSGRPSVKASLASTVPGVGVQAVEASLSSRWGMAFTSFGNPVGAVVMTPKRPSGGEMYITISPPQEGSNEIVMLQCTIRQPALKVDQAALEDVETCLTPVMHDSEIGVTRARIEARAKLLPVPSIVTEKFDRFSVGLQYTSADAFGLFVLGPGTTLPGTVVR